VVKPAPDAALHVAAAHVHHPAGGQVRARHHLGPEHVRVVAGMRPGSPQADALEHTALGAQPGEGRVGSAARGAVASAQRQLDLARHHRLMPGQGPRRCIGNEGRAAEDAQQAGRGVERCRVAWRVAALDHLLAHRAANGCHSGHRRTGDGAHQCAGQHHDVAEVGLQTPDQRVAHGGELADQAPVAHQLPTQQEQRNRQQREDGDGVVGDRWQHRPVDVPPLGVGHHQQCEGHADRHAQ
jgi:hypothetical protein